MYIRFSFILLLAASFEIFAASSVDGNNAEVRAAGSAGAVASALEISPSAGMSPAIRKIQDGLYAAQIESDLWFVLEQQNADSVKGWQAFSEAQEECRKRLKDRTKDCPPAEFKKVTVNIGGVDYEFYENIPRPHLKGTINEWRDVILGLLGGRIAFDCRLESYGRDLDQLWVTYALNTEEPPVAPCTGENFKNVEMVFTVATEEGAPFTNHMGIFRSITYIENHFDAAADAKESFPIHKRISALLHAFAGHVMHALFPDKIYMITLPLYEERRLIVESLPTEAVYIGDDKFYEELASNPAKIVSAHQSLHGKRPHGTYSDAVQRVLDKRYSPIRYTPLSDPVPIETRPGCEVKDFLWELFDKGYKVYEAKRSSVEGLSSLRWFLSDEGMSLWTQGSAGSDPMIIFLSAFAKVFEEGLHKRASSVDKY